jgi:hypothetical protein
MADSNSDQVEDNDPRVKKPRHQPSGCTMSGNKQDVVKHGYGNVVPIGVKNIYNKGGQIVPYIFEWQKYLDLDFRNNQHHIVIPYQTLTFWTGMWDRPTQNTQFLQPPQHHIRHNIPLQPPHGRSLCGNSTTATPARVHQHYHQRL